MRKILLIGISTFALGAAAMATAEQKFASKDETFRMMDLFGDVLTEIDRQYVVPVDNKKLIEAALDGMLTSLDPHSGYLDAAGYSDLSDQTRGDYGGLGIQLGGEDGAIKIVAPMDGTPASRAHLLAGDYITAIDGQSIIGQNINEAIKQMRGPVGTPVTLTIVREKQDPFTIKLTREVIVVKSVSRQVFGDYGYVRVAGFDEKTGRETTSALRALKAENPHMKGLILDLRNNPGGLVNQAVAVASDFLDGGEVVSQRGRDPRDIQRYNAVSANGDMIKGLPLVVLVNNGSASAAEIVAGALKDRERATVIGLTTFGKGSVQSVIPLHDGKDGALKLTIARYYTPAGLSIQKTGITPDLQVAYSHRQAEAVFDEALQFSEASLKGALDTQEGKVRKAPEAIEVPVAAADPVKLAEAKAAAKKAKEEAKAGKTDVKADDAPSIDGDEDIPQMANTGLAHLNPKTDFQLARAIAVLQAGSVAQAVKLYPAETYTPTKPKFTTASIAPATGPAGATAAGKAAATPAKPLNKAKTR